VFEAVKQPEHEAEKRTYFTHLVQAEYPDRGGMNGGQTKAAVPCPQEAQHTHARTDGASIRPNDSCDKCFCLAHSAMGTGSQ